MQSNPKSNAKSMADMVHGEVSELFYKMVYSPSEEDRRRFALLFVEKFGQLVRAGAFEGCDG